MDPLAIVKRYYLKVALPILLITLLAENLMTQDSYLNKWLKRVIMVGNGSQYLLARAGPREERVHRGPTYFESLNFDIHSGDDAKTMPLKDFMTKYVTLYEPAVFLGLVDD